MPACKYTNLSTKDQKKLQELKHREDIVITNTKKGGKLVRLHIKDSIKKSAR